MINRAIIRIGVVLLLPVLLVGCFEEQLITLEDHPPVVEWQPPNPANDNRRALTVTLDPDQQDAEEITLNVNLITEQHNNDRTVGVVVDEEASDAQHGVHFDILNDDNVVVIPANSSFGDVDVVVNADQLQNGEEVEALLFLEDIGDLGVAENFRDFELTIQKEEVEFAADLVGTDAFPDVEGDIDVQGDTPGERFTADIVLDGLDDEETYTWAIYRGTADAPEGIVGVEGDYPDLEPAEGETIADAEAEVDVRLYQADDLHVQVYHGSDLVVSQDLE